MTTAAFWGLCFQEAPKTEHRQPFECIECGGPVDWNGRYFLATCRAHHVSSGGVRERCSQGHELTTENRLPGAGECRLCKNERHRQYRARLRQELLDYVRGAEAAA